MTKIILLFTLILIVSCGKAVEEKSDADLQEEVIIDGTYMAILVPVNGKYSSQVHGEVKVSKYSDEFKVEVRLNDSPPGIHKQSLHVSSNCPKLENDENRDGYIDQAESQKRTGAMIVPFDGDLSSQSQGEMNYPSGNYHYSKSTSYYLMLSDLHLHDEVSNDGMVKLNEKDLTLERRVVAVYAKSSQLPFSVLNGEVPIACGVLTRITDSEVPQDTTWEEERVPRRPRNPSPRPSPRPRPEPEPEVDTDNTNSGSWWDRWRQRWRRWRDRWRDGDVADETLMQMEFQETILTNFRSFLKVALRGKLNQFPDGSLLQ